jgi:hypothetical protein
MPLGAGIISFEWQRPPICIHFVLRRLQSQWAEMRRLWSVANSEQVMSRDGLGDDEYVGKIART